MTVSSLQSRSARRHPGFRQQPDFRALSNRILEHAGTGIPRAQFLKEASQILIEFTGCDVVRLVLQDRGRRYCCELTCGTSQPFRFEVTPNPPDESAEITWSAGKNEALEQLCRDIMHKRIDPSAPWFTDNGSLFTSDVDSLPIDGLREPCPEWGPGIHVDEDCRSFALIPIEAGPERIGLLQLQSAKKALSYEREIEPCERLAQTLGIALVHRRLQVELRHADRLATIGLLGAGLAHDLNESLANILGFAQLAAKDPALTVQTRQDIEKIVSTTLHARQVTTRLLVFARETPTEKTRVNLSSLVEDGLHFLQSRCAKAGIELVRNLPKGLPEITADRTQMLQVLINLVVNSVQAMPHGGRLTITTASDDAHVLLSVEDTGTGMSEEVMKDIFNPLFTTKDVDQGTGLGLPVVHGIVTSHGGTVAVESTVDRGTKFVIRLPMDTPQNNSGGQDG